jgi:hypothetical protein
MIPTRTHVPYGGDMRGMALDPYVFTDPQEFQKAVTAGYGTDVATLTGGGSLRLQSIEPTLLRSIQDDSHFKMFNKLQATNATATVDEYTLKPWIGGYPGSGFNSEMGIIPETQGRYERHVGLVKFLMTRRQVSVVQQSQRTLVDTIAEEKVDATRELKTSAEWGFFYGDSTVNTLEYDGLKPIILATADPDLIVDMQGQGLSYVAKEIINMAAAISSYGRFGRVTDIFTSLAVQSAELDQKLDPAFRVVASGGNGGNVRMGTPVIGIRTSFGDIGCNPDVFIQESTIPFEARPAPFNSMTTAPSVTSIAGVNAPNVGSKFVAASAGAYYYGVSAVGTGVRSPVTLSAAVSLVAGDGVTLTITHGANLTADQTFFEIYRGRRNGTNAALDLRLLTRVARSAGATTVVVDLGANVPGTSDAFLLNMAAGQNVVTMRRLLPMTLFPLYPVNQAVRPWAQLLFLYLRVAKPKQVGIIRNILPGNATWKPF